MTRSQIFTSLECMADSIQLTDIDGSRVLGTENMAFFSKVFGDRWDKTGPQLLSGEITDNEFFELRSEMISESRHNVFLSRLEKSLTQAFEHQTGIKYV